MLFPGDRLEVAFRQIKLAASTEGLCTFLLASSEPDSVCATKLIADALKSESIAFSSKAVDNFEEASKILTTILTEGNVRSVILVNCGGTVNLTQRFGDLVNDVFIYVIDSHRPLHHGNLSTRSNRVLVFGGEIDSVDENVPDEEDPDDASLSDEEEALDEEDDDKKSEENDEPNESKIADDDNEEEAFPETTRDSHASTSLSPRKAVALESPRKKRAKLDRVVNYYSRTYIGDPASHVVFSWLQQLGKDKNLSSWLAIVGITSRYLSLDMDDQTYMHYVDTYKEIVHDRNLKVQPQRLLKSDGVSIGIPNPQNEQIAFVETDLRLVLYRHWSLYEACYNTSYFASRFGVWSPDSDGELARVYAKLGLSLKLAKQKFSYMDADNKLNVRTNMPGVVKADSEFRRMTQASFTFRAGYGVEFSAEDVARCIAALLQGGKGGARGGLSGDATTGSDEGFTSAYDMLVKNERKLSDQALELAMSHVRLLTEETKTVIQGGLVQSAGDFRFATIELHDDAKDNLNDNDNDRTNFFSSPSSVVLLAKNVINAHQGSQKWLKNNGKPLVMAVSRAGRALVVGVPCPAEVGEVVQNPFGKLFARTAREIGVDVAPDRFQDTFIIQLASDDVQRFLLSLSEFFRV